MTFSSICPHTLTMQIMKNILTLLKMPSCVSPKKCIFCHILKTMMIINKYKSEKEEKIVDACKYGSFESKHAQLWRERMFVENKCCMCVHI
jgi:hypothetical protein